MMQIPLPKTIKGSENVPLQQEYLVNCINTGTAIQSRPAMISVSEISGPPRGSFEYSGTLYTVFGQNLYSGTNLTLVGAVDGDLSIRFAEGFNHLCLVGGESGYTLTEAGVLAEITDTDLPSVRDVSRIDGRFIFTPTDGGPLLYSDVGNAGAIGSLSFFDAEVLPDVNKNTSSIKNDLFVWGEKILERFRNQGTEDAPFLRVSGSVSSIGIVSALIEIGDSCLFVGRDRDAGYGIYGLVESIPTRISTAPIDEILNAYTEEQLESIESMRFVWFGLDVFVFSLPDRDLYLCNGNWGYFDSGIVTSYQIEKWGYKYSVLHNGTWYAQKSDGLYKMTSGYEDSVGLFSIRIRTFARDPSEGVFEVARLEASLAQGSHDKGSVGLSLSRNGRLWSDPFYRDTANIGEYDHQLVWNMAGGLGRYDGYCGMILHSTDDIRFSLDNLVMA